MIIFAILSACAAVCLSYGAGLSWSGGKLYAPDKAGAVLVLFSAACCVYMLQAAYVATYEEWVLPDGVYLFDVNLHDHSSVMWVPCGVLLLCIVVFFVTHFLAKLKKI